MRIHSFAVVTVLIAAFGAMADPAADTRALEGVWSPVDFRFAGKAGVPETIKNFKLAITATGYSLNTGKEIDKGTLAIDTSKKPATMDIVGTEGPNKGKTILAIWKLDGGKLTICYALKDKERPTAFESTPENGWLLASYEKARP